MKKKILADFQIYISVSLRRFEEYIIFLFKHQLKNKFENLAEIIDENLDILYIVETYLSNQLFVNGCHKPYFQPTITCSKLRIKTIEQRCEICSKSKTPPKRRH